MSLNIVDVIQAKKVALGNRVHASLQNGTPRWKPIQSSNVNAGYVERNQELVLRGFIRQQNSTYEVDVAHVENSLLPENLQAEPNAAAESTITLIVDAVNKGKSLDDSNLVLEIAEGIHAAWLERRRLLNGGQLPQWIVDQKQNVLVSELSEDRQRWYYSIAQEGINLIKDYVSRR